MTMQRIYAHTIHYGDRTYREHILTLDPQGEVSLAPFVRELHSTRYYPGEVEVKVVTGTDGTPSLEVTTLPGTPADDIPPLLFAPVLKSVIWGGTRIAQLKHIPADNPTIGESWEISAIPGMESVVLNGPDTGLTLTGMVRRHGASLTGSACLERFGDSFPLLVKIIDARQDLSLQVHPGDAMARERHNTSGKSEMWYVLESAPGACVYAGFESDVTPELYHRAVADGRVLDLVRRLPAHAGDLFYLPAGMIHSLGAGNLVIEIQQSSDISYRIHDFGRLDSNGQPRQLHLAEADMALDYAGSPARINVADTVPGESAPLVQCRHFDVRLLNVEKSHRLELSDRDTFVILTCVRGEIQVSDDRNNTITLDRGRTCLIPAMAAWVDLRGNGELLITTLP